MGDQDKELSSQLSSHELEAVVILHTKMMGRASVPQVPSVSMEVRTGGPICNPPDQLYLKLQHKSTDLSP